MASVWLEMFKEPIIFFADGFINFYLILNEPIIRISKSRGKIIGIFFNSATLNKETYEQISGRNKVCYGFE